MMIATNQRRGAEVFGVTLAEHLSERGFDVSLLALNPSPTEPRLDLEPAGRSRLDPRMWWAAYSAARGADVGFGGRFDRRRLSVRSSRPRSAI